MQKMGFLWGAVSSKDQIENVSLEEQLRQGMEQAARHGVNITGALVVPGKSRHIVLFDRAACTVTGYMLTPDDLNRMQATPLVDIMRTKEQVYPYAELLTVLESAKPNELVFFFLNRSRLGRTAALSQTVIGLCRENRVKPYDLESPPSSLEITNSRDEAYVGAFKSTEAENQIWAIQDNHRTGMIRRVKNGRMPGKINFGYIPVYGPKKGKLGGKAQALEIVDYTIDEEAATTVRLIVSLYLDRGFGAMNIADHLNRVGRPAPMGGQWGHSQVTFFLRRIWRYAGYAELNVYSATGRPYVRARGLWPAIISEDDARRVIDERGKRNDARRSVHTVYRFTRMCYCGVCDTRLHSHNKRKRKRLKSGDVAEYRMVVYRCPGGHGMIGEKKIFAKVEELIRRLDDDAFRAAYTVAPEADGGATVAAEIATLQAQLDKAKANITKVDKDYYIHSTIEEDRHREIVGTIKKQMLAIQSELTTLHDALHEIETDNQRGQRIEDVRASGLPRLHDDDVRASNAWLRQRFKITIAERKVASIEIL